MRQYLQGWLLVAAALTTAYASAAQPTNVLPVPTDRVDIFRCDTTYNYTPGNRLGGIVYPSGTVATYGRDANGRVNAISARSAGQTTAVPVVSDVTYLPFGPVQDVVYGDGSLTLKRTFDLNYQGTDIQGLGLDLHVRRDANGNIVALHEGRFITHAAEQRYRYDALQRLTDKIGPWGFFSDHYDYNATGDRQSRERAGLLTERYTYQPGTHRLGGIATPGWHGWKTADVLSDAAGNIVRMPRQGQALDLDYAANNRLAQVAKAGRVVGSYVYDANGLRAQKTTSSHARQFIYDDQAHLLGDYTPDTQQKREYLWLEGNLVATLDTSARGVSIHYVGTDFLGTPRRVVNAGGYPVWGWAYAGEVFGDTPALGSYDLAMRFPGQYHDAESGLNYNVHRDYDAATGRYVESDPIGLRGGLSSYAYVGSNPVNASDLLGLFHLSRKSGPEGGVWCDHGAWKTWVKVPDQYKSCPQIGICAVAHEQSHIEDVDRDNPGLCHWYSNLIGGLYLAEDTDAEAMATEYKAFNTELDCLERLLKQEKCEGDGCRPLIEWRESTIKQYYIPKVLGGSYGSVDD
ncbi:RHS repeat-associated core domain-containing protein [Rhodanobacter caeni]|uniref:RHS repeat domain-containing protein n=1 Tax=Rhodanobacter caeni TaxID=657654 RepID=UPI0031DCBC5C